MERRTGGTWAGVRTWVWMRCESNLVGANVSLDCNKNEDCLGFGGLQQDRKEEERTEGRRS
jgi:hypothetical protein